MKRKLSVQIRNEWRSNLWLAAEFLIVSVVMWYVLVTVFSTLWVRTGSPGYDISNVWLVGYDVMNSEGRDYDESRGDDESLRQDMAAMLRRVREAPGVKALALSYSAIPYNYNFNGSNYSMIRKDGSEEVFNGFFARKMISPSYITVMSIPGANGETPEELTEFIKDGRGVLVSENTFEMQDVVEYNTPSRIAEDWLFLDNDSSTLPLKTIVNQQRNDYEPCYFRTFMQASINEDFPQNPLALYEITVKVDPSKEKEFAEWINEKIGNYLSVGNVYVNDLIPLEAIRTLNQQDIMSSVNNRVAIVVFLMVSIFLGLLGAFWFRTQNRTGEIAIRKVNGATSGQVFRRLMGEGLLILAAVTPIAWICDWGLIKLDLVVFLFTDSAPLWQYITCAAITLALVVLAVTVGIWFPARKAMKIDPASALAHE
ncbi:MAG: FtsX-like permease family protein [Paramuribaculum sp.]|nr:FtsX-like permease family protein [Paramuribaculum sp.]